MTRHMIILAALAVLLATSPASAACQFKFQCNPMVDMTKPRAILDSDGLGVRAEIYNPNVPGKPLQIRDPRTLRVLGFIERDGTLTDTRRRKVGEIK